MSRLTQNVIYQTIGGIVDHINELRAEELLEAISTIRRATLEQLENQEINLEDALGYVEELKRLIANPSKILGSMATKHGEIAEMFEVYMRNAQSVLKGLEPNATFDNVGRTAPTDYIIDGIEVQSKFYNGINNTLKAVIEHNDQYKFAKNGKFYHIPKDQYEIIQKILNGEKIEDLNDRSIRKILEKINEIEQSSGKSFNEVVKPSVSDYKDIQSGNIDKTITQEEEKLIQENEKIKSDIERSGKEQEAEATSEYGPSIEEGVKVALIAAILAGTINAAIAIYKKRKEGITFSEYKVDDWKDIGFDFGKGAAKGGISGGAIYAITNLTDTAAPIASAYVSAAFGIAALAKDYHAGLLRKDELILQGEMICAESAIIGLGSLIGQTLIPFPAVGMIVGSIVTSTLIGFSKQYALNLEDELNEKLDQDYNAAMERISDSYRLEVQRIMVHYKTLGGLTQMAFSYELNYNLKFKASINLANAHGVKTEHVLKSINDVDYFMSN